MFEHDEGLQVLNSEFLAAVRDGAPENAGMLVTSFSGCPMTTPKRNWIGEPYVGAEQVDSWAKLNTYYSVSALAPDSSGKLRRRGDSFVRLLVLVADDISATDPAATELTYFLQTSANSCQGGIFLDPTDPDCADPKLVRRVLQELARQRGGKVDASGNSSTRWVRLPVGTNHKAKYGAPFAHRLLRWDPAVRMKLIDAAEILGVELQKSRKQPDDKNSKVRATGGRDKVAEGGRNEFLSRRAYAMKRGGFSQESILAALSALNLERCSPPLEAAEVDAIANGKMDIPADELALGVWEDFFAFMPAHQYLHAPTGALWPASSVDGRCVWPVDERGNAVRPSAWLDRNRPVEQLVWAPDKPQTIIEDLVMRDSGWVFHEGARVFNMFLPLPLLAGDAAKATPWIEHLVRIYPDDWQHILNWLAHRVQRPGEKCNHALVLGGAQGIGKDSLLEPVKAAVGAWNWSDISPSQMVGRFNGWARSIVTRVSEARDLGDVDRFKFYEHSKVYIAAPPDVLRVDEKHLREAYIRNVMGMVITTNHATDGLYLPAEDRRHYVAWSPRTRADFRPGYFGELWNWMRDGGAGHVAAHLRSIDLSAFDPKAPPARTPAFYRMVAAGEAPESGELRDIIDAMGQPEALTLLHLAVKAGELGMTDVAHELFDRKVRRAIPHRLERVGYVQVQNPDASDSMFKIDGRRCNVYARRDLPSSAQVKAARELAPATSDAMP
jgi:hypothetical protein